MKAIRTACLTIILTFVLCMLYHAGTVGLNARNDFEVVSGALIMAVTFIGGPYGYYQIYKKREDNEKPKDPVA